MGRVASRFIMHVLGFGFVLTALLTAAGTVAAQGDVCVSIHDGVKVNEGESTCHSDATSRAVAVNESTALAGTDSQAIAINDSGAFAIFDSQATAINDSEASASFGGEVTSINGCRTTVFFESERNVNCP